MIIHNVEQRSEEWYALRAGMPTASEFSNLLTPKTLKPAASITPYAAQLANEIYTGEVNPDGFAGNDWTDRGANWEEAAISWYEFSFGVTVERVGFVTDDDNSIGCSPDGLVGGDGMIEIKSLKASNHTLAMFGHYKDGESPADYRAQTQGQMMICERAWCDLLFFHDRLPPFVIRQAPDTEYIGKLQDDVNTLLETRDSILAMLTDDQHATQAAAE